MAAHATGVVLLGESDPAAALPQLRMAATAWKSLRLPYERARTGIQVGLACAALGDRTAAELEFDNARDVFIQLGAVPDLQRVTALSAAPVVPASPSGDQAALSNREREVLAHLAAGQTNREIAAQLLISQHTVARHLENIYAKLGVRTRAAATAFAYEHDLV